MSRIHNPYGDGQASGRITEGTARYLRDGRPGS
jgi:UDP-N-acetylglucosamine 2-epimerase